MLSLAKLALGQEAYSGAERLDLVGAVEDGDLGTLLRGLSPADGERLRAPARQRTITVRTLHQASGEWRDGPKTLAPVAGYDLVFSCPQSVSLVHARRSPGRSGRSGRARVRWGGWA